MSDTRFRSDLLASKPVLSAVRWSAFPYVFQVATLALFGWLIVNGWGVGLGREAAFLKVLRKTNATTLLTWGIWWPLMVFGAIAFGRAWCAVCPMELVDNIFGRIARGVGIGGWGIPRWLSAGFGILVLFVVLQFLVGGLALHRNPAYTSWMLLTLVAIAAISGVVFTQRRSFCKAFCPANLLLSVHGRMTPLQIAAADTGTCESCKTKDCIRKDRSGRWNGASCPSGVPVYSRRDGDACVLCFQCAKACPHDNVGFGLQASAPRRRSPLSVAEALFVVVASGFVMHELFTEIKPLEGIFHYPAEQLHAILGEPIAWSWMHASWYLVGFPAALWGIVLGVLRAAGRRGIAETLAASALVLAPVIAACHLSKALAKLNSWGPYLTTSLADPQGVPAAETFFSKASSAAPAGALPFTVIAAAAIALCLSGGVYAWSRRAPTGSMLPRLIVPLVGVMYLTVLVLWLVAH